VDVLSLFDGMSCGKLALEKAGIKLGKYFASEIEESAIQISKLRHKEIIHLGNVEEIKANKLPNIDLLIGGSPCQGFSMMGKQLNFDDPRSVLFFEFLRLLEETKPKFFFLENVMMKKEAKDIISKHLKTEPHKINSSLFSAQNRERLYWTNIAFDMNIRDLGIGIDSIIENDVEPVFVHNLYGGFGERKPRIFEKKSPTIRTAKGGGHIPNLMLKGTNIHSNCSLDYAKANSRKTKPIEAERLQTLPDDYTKAEGISDTQRFNMIGNGWTVQAIAHMFAGLN
jgi:DNA-cytosine methyltransferase